MSFAWSAPVLPRPATSAVLVCALLGCASAAPAADFDPCVRLAARRYAAYGLTPELLARHVAVESGGGAAGTYAIGINGGLRLPRQPRDRAEAVTLARALLNAGANLDLGAGQINSGHLAWLAEQGIGLEQLFDRCTNLRVAATLIATNLATYGDTWNAVGAYNVACRRLSPAECERRRARYAWRVYRARSAAHPQRPVLPAPVISRASRAASEVRQ